MAGKKLKTPPKRKQREALQSIGAIIPPTDNNMHRTNFDQNLRAKSTASNASVGQSASHSSKTRKTAELAARKNKIGSAKYKARGGKPVFRNPMKLD